MFVVYNKEKQKVPIKIWLDSINDIEASCLEQAMMVANHPCIFKHLSLMPDTHTGYSLPIGGVACLKHAVSPYFVGVDIGCGMGAVRTSISASILSIDQIRGVLDDVKRFIPMGEGHAHEHCQKWNGFDMFMDYEKTDGYGEYPGWWNSDMWRLAERNLRTLGGGNHFMEVQKGDDGYIWLMIHTGSRNLGHKIATYHHEKAVLANKRWHSNLPDETMAFLPADSDEGSLYIQDMHFAMEYAAENRKRIMEAFKKSFMRIIGDCFFDKEVNIHHNFASLENHFGENVWVHRKGATMARKGQLGIIPGSMGTSSYIVQGKGNSDSYMSCSHGAGRKMGRMNASRTLSKEECDKSMTGIVFDGFGKMENRKGKNEDLFDLGESPLAYKNIDDVIRCESDLIDPIVKLSPLGVLKG